MMQEQEAGGQARWLGGYKGCWYHKEGEAPRAIAQRGVGCGKSRVGGAGWSQEIRVRVL